jgi:hypothetical protein
VVSPACLVAAAVAAVAAGGEDDEEATGNDGVPAVLLALLDISKLEPHTIAL